MKVTFRVKRTPFSWKAFFGWLIIIGLIVRWVKKK